MQENRMIDGIDTPYVLLCYTVLSEIKLNIKRYMLLLMYGHSANKPCMRTYFFRMYSEDGCQCCRILWVFTIGQSLCNVLHSYWTWSVYQSISWSVRSINTTKERLSVLVERCVQRDSSLFTRATTVTLCCFSPLTDHLVCVQESLLRPLFRATPCYSRNFITMYTLYIYK